jgi:hypothetical protein
MKRVRVASDGWNFELEGSGEPVTPVGGNILDGLHPGQGTLFQRFDAADCDRRLGAMAELGLNCLRQAIGVNEVFDPGSGLKAAGMRNWDAFIRLAEKRGIWLMPVGGYLGGNDWFDVERLADSGAQLDADCAFWAAFAGHYRRHPAIWAWDLRNELLYDTRSHAVAPGAADERRIEAQLKEGWPAWLERKYGTVDAMNRAHGAARSSFEGVPGSVRFEEAPFDRRACDFRRYLEERGREWCRRQCEAIRAAAPGHMVVQGNNGWLCPDMDPWLANGFPNRALHDLFDFVTFHPYPAWQAGPGGRGDPLDGGEALRFWLSACVGMARLDYYAKPVVVQEFGWYGGGASRFLGDLPHRSEREHADYTRALVDALLPHANGFLNWPTFDMPEANDISNHGGIFTSDGRRKELAAAYADLARRLRGRRAARGDGTITLEVPLEGLYTSRACQDRMWERVHEVIRAGGVPDFRFPEP